MPSTALQKTGSSPPNPDPSPIRTMKSSTAMPSALRSAASFSPTRTGPPAPERARSLAVRSRACPAVKASASKHAAGSPIAERTGRAANSTPSRTRPISAGKMARNVSAPNLATAQTSPGASFSPGSCGSKRATRAQLRSKSRTSPARTSTRSMSRPAAARNSAARSTSTLCSSPSSPGVSATLPALPVRYTRFAPSGTRSPRAGLLVCGHPKSSSGFPARRCADWRANGQAVPASR